MFLVSESLFLMPKFEQKLCFGLLQLKKLKKLHFLAKNPISPYILCLALKCTKIVFGDVLDRKKKNIFRLLKDIYLIKLQTGFSETGYPMILAKESYFIIACFLLTALI